MPHRSITALLLTGRLRDIFGDCHMAQTIDITAETREAATQTAKLPLMQTVLLGTMDGPSGPRAIIRNGFGGVETVGIGSYINGGEVTAIRGDTLYLSRGGRGHKMTIPGS